MINLLNELIKLKEQKNNEENSEKRKVEDSEGISAYVDLPVYQKRKTILFPDEPFPSEEFGKKDSVTLNGNIELFEESSIKTADPVDEEPGASFASRTADQYPNSIVYPDEPRPSEEFYKRGIVNFDESSKEALETRDEEHVGVPLENHEQESPKNKEINNEIFLKALKKLFKKRLHKINK